MTNNITFIARPSETGEMKMQHFYSLFYTEYTKWNDFDIM